MESYFVTIRSVRNITHDVIQLQTTKPSGYNFVSGQATELAINKAGWQDEKRPFTFTSLPSDDYLEFTIKTYPSHNGVTNQLLQLKVNDELILHDVWGTIAYKGEGLFIAGGAGVTPFISIFRELESTGRIVNNKLLCANKTKADIIHEEYFSKILGSNFINILSEEETEGYYHGHISKELLHKYITTNNQLFYVCGPEPMMDAVEQQLTELEVSKEAIIKEQF